MTLSNLQMSCVSSITYLLYTNDRSMNYVWSPARRYVRAHNMARVWTILRILVFLSWFRGAFRTRYTIPHSFYVRLNQSTISHLFAETSSR